MRKSPANRVPVALVVLVAVGLLGAACEYRLDTTRHLPERGSLGQEIQQILQKDLDRLHPQKGLAFARERERFIRAIDTLMPEDLLDKLQEFFVAMLPLYDEQVLPGAIRPLACFLEELSRDERLAAALWYGGHTSGYGEPRGNRLLRRVLAHPGLKELLGRLARLWLANDGLDDDFQPDGNETDVFSGLLAELARHLRQADISPEAGPDSLFDLLFLQDGRLGDGDPLWQVRLDRRGRALAAVDAQGRVQAPFFDGDGDGLADVDPAGGDYLDDQGGPLEVPPPFASDGSRPQQQGRLLYQYVDLNSSVLAALLDQLEPLVRDGILWDLDDTLDALLGPQVARADDQGVYPGYDPDASPLVALVHALAATLDYQRAPELVEAVLTLAELREPQLARLLHEMDRAGDIADGYPDLELAEHNRLLDDLLPHLQEMAQRGYLGDYLRAFADPRSAGLQQGLAQMIRYRDHLDDEVPGGMQFSLLTDFTASDSEYANRSNLQKMLHLTADTNGVSHSTAIAGFDVFTIEDMLVFWLDSAADSGTPGEGLAHVPWYVVAAVNEFDTEYPPVEQVNRFMNHDHSILGNPVGREGYELLHYNAESLLALEVSGLLEALRPGITAVAVRDRDQARPGTKVFADLLAALHPHYSSNVPNHSPACAELRRLEPLLLDVLDHTEMVDALVELLGSLDGLKTAGGLDVVDELAAFTRFLLEPDSALLRHDGANWVFAADGVTQVSPLNRFYLLLDAWRRLDDAVAGDPAADAALSRVGERLHERFLQVEQSGQLWRLANRRAWTVLLDSLAFARDRLREYRDAGTLADELAELEDDVRELAGGRLLPRLVQAFELVAADAQLPDQIDSLALDLLDGTDQQWRRRLRQEVAWLLQQLFVDRVVVPAGQALAPLLDAEGAGRSFLPGSGCLAPGPPNDLASRTMTLLARLSDIVVAGRDVLGELLGNAAGSSDGSDEDHPLGDLGEVIAAVHREDPEQTDEKQPADWQSILHQVADYLLDGERGVEKLYQMVARRKGM